MIFIGGTYPKTEHFRSKVKSHCFHCNNDGYWVLQKTRQVLNLFFLPVATLKTEYLYYCAVCGQGQTLEREEFEEKVRRAEKISASSGH